MSQKRAKAIRKAERLTYDAQCVLIRGLIIYITSEMDATKGELDGLLSFGVPVSGYQVKTKQRNARSREVTAQLKSFPGSENKDWTTRDAVYSKIEGSIRNCRNFWAHAKFIKRDDVLILWLDKCLVYPEGIPYEHVAVHGMVFLDELEPYREYLSSQYKNVKTLLVTHGLLPDSNESVEKV